MSTLSTCLLIIGSGPAGYSAAIYAARYGVKPCLFAGSQIGGQLTYTSEIENFPGFPEPIQGGELMSRMRQQCENLGVKILNDEIISVDFSSRPFICHSSSGEEFASLAVIIATGAAPRLLNIENENKFFGYGVSICSTCDGFFYKNKTAAVVGGGNTAAMEALHLAKVAKKVYLIHRQDKLRADQIMQDRIMSTPNIEILWNTTVTSLNGTDNPTSLTSAIIHNIKTNENTKIDIDGLFLSVGSTPRTKLFTGKIDMDDRGYIITKPNSCQTNIEGVFAAGDVQNSNFKQAIIAAGSGAIAALEAEKFLEGFK